MRRYERLAGFAGFSLAVVATLGACAHGSAEHTPAPANTVSTDAQFIFDGLGGQQPIIQVYPGIRDTPADKDSHGRAFNDGESVKAICVAMDGRLVTSDPSAGERQAQSTTWVRIQDAAGGQEQFATLTYGHLSPAGVALRACTPAEIK